MSASTYLATFEELRRRKRWTTDTTVLRFAALTLASIETPGAAAVLEQAAEELKASAGWFGSLRSVVRYCVAATILRAGLRPKDVAEQIEVLRQEFRRRRMTRGGIREVFAALVLLLRTGGKPPAAATLDRLQELLARWRKDHWWLTGVDDYPLAALHASGEEAIDPLVARIEAIYQGLRGAGFSRGNGLQLASHLLAISNEPADALVRRAADLAAALRAEGIKVRADRYDEVAALVLAGRAAKPTAKRMAELTNELRAARPRPNVDMAFSLAAGLILSEAAGHARQLHDVRDVAALASVQAILEQHAAAAGAAAAAGS